MLRLRFTSQFVYHLLTLPFVQPRHGLGCCYSAIRAAFAWAADKFHAFGVDLGEETGILAISLMANRRLHTLERFLWFGIVFVSFSIIHSLSTVQLKRYINSPTVISMERDYRGWHGPLPAVTLCYNDHMDTFKANEYIQNQWNVSIIDNDYFYFMSFLHAVVNATASNYIDLARFAEDERFEEVNLTELVHALDRPFEQTLISFDKQSSAIQITHVMTERGLCYAINSPMSEILTGRNIEYKDIIQPLMCEYGKQRCFIKMDLYESTGTVAVHSPFEVSASDADVIALHKSDEIIASFKVLETVASKNLRDLHVNQRKCVFYDEETSQLKVYSKTLCLVRCRAVMAMDMCNCVPFFYAFLDGPSCSPAGFECLMNFKWPIWALNICKCPNTCTEIEYTVQTVKKSFWGVKADKEVINTVAVTASFRWDVLPPKVRMRRDVVFGFEDLIVSFGGTLALSFGFSLISIVRFGYVITYHRIMIIVELVAGLKSYCVRGLRDWKWKQPYNRNFLAQKKLRTRLALRKRTQQITADARLSKAGHLSSGSIADHCSEYEYNVPTDVSIEAPEFEYVN